MRSADVLGVPESELAPVVIQNDRSVSEAPEADPRMLEPAARRAFFLALPSKRPAESFICNAAGRGLYVIRDGFLVGDATPANRYRHGKIIEVMEYFDTELTNSVFGP